MLCRPRSLPFSSKKKCSSINHYRYVSFITSKCCFETFQITSPCCSSSHPRPACSSLSPFPLEGLRRAEGYLSDVGRTSLQDVKACWTSLSGLPPGSRALVRAAARSTPRTHTRNSRLYRLPLSEWRLHVFTVAQVIV